MHIREEFFNNVLRLSAEEDGDDSIYVADITEEKIGTNSIMNKGLYSKEKPVRLAIRKDRGGKVFLVVVDTPEIIPGSTPEEQKVFIAQKGKSPVVK